MIKSKKTKKLALSKELVRTLQDDELQSAAGGRINLSRNSQCNCPTFTCDGCTLF
jgi:hypothetical protein